MKTPKLCPKCCSEEFGPKTCVDPKVRKFFCEDCLTEFTVRGDRASDGFDVLCPDCWVKMDATGSTEKHPDCNTFTCPLCNYEVPETASSTEGLKEWLDTAEMTPEEWLNSDKKRK
jgi:hypothetical protein